MSGSDKKKSSGSSSGGNDPEKEIDEPGKEKSCTEEETRQRRGKGVFCLRFNGVKRNLLLLQRRRRRRKKKKASLVNSKVSGGYDGGGLCCCLCIKQPMTLDTSIESPTSDPNSKEFTYDMMRVLIEKNEFYSKECNAHLNDKLSS